MKKSNIFLVIVLFTILNSIGFCWEIEDVREKPSEVANYFINCMARGDIYHMNMLLLPDLLDEYRSNKSTENFKKMDKMYAIARSVKNRQKKVFITNIYTKVKSRNGDSVIAILKYKYRLTNRKTKNKAIVNREDKIVLTRFYGYWLISEILDK